MGIKTKARLAAWSLALVQIGCGSESSDTGPMDSTSESTATAGTEAGEPPMAGTGMEPNEGMPEAGTAAQAGTGPGLPRAGIGGGEAGHAGMPMEPGPMMGERPDPRGQCEIDSGFPDDHACLLPPAPGEGMQIHVGPSDYDDPADVNRFVYHPGQESSECWTFHTPNTEEVYYQNYELSGRSGTHHIINTMYTVELVDGGFTICADGGTGTTAEILANLPGASKAYMPLRTIAPENANLGRSVPANTPAQADMHYFNFTDQDILREFWMNIYFIPKEQVESHSNQIRGMGGLEWFGAPIQPGTDYVYQYSAPIEQDGRIIELLGHYHAHGKRFTAYLQRASGEQMKVFEMYDYLDPLNFQYNSVTQNPPFSETAGGAYSGILEVKAGDTLQWECHIVNDSQTALSYTNHVETGEMCNLWGASVGPKIDAVLFGETPF